MGWKKTFIVRMNFMRSQRVSVCMVDVEWSWVLRKWQQAPIPLSFSHSTVFKSIPLDAFRRTKKPKGRDSRTSCFGPRILDQCCLTHRRQFSIVWTLIDHRNDVKMFKTHWNHSPAARGFILKSWTFWRHFCGRYVYRPWKIVVDFFFLQ